MRFTSEKSGQVDYPVRSVDMLTIHSVPIKGDGYQSWTYTFTGTAQFDYCVMRFYEK